MAWNVPVSGVITYTVGLDSDGYISPSASVDTKKISVNGFRTPSNGQSDSDTRNVEMYFLEYLFGLNVLDRTFALKATVG